MSSALPQTSAMAGGVRFRLSVMMFLQFFIWGAWFELGFNYIPSLGFDSTWQNPLVFGAFNIGALVALFFSTQFADRLFAAERFLAVSHLIGGLAILALFFLPGKLGTAPGEYVTVTLTGPGEQLTDARGKTVEGLTAEVRGVPGMLAKIGDDPKKNPTLTARVTEVKTDAAGSVLVVVPETIAPFWPYFLCMLIHSIFYVPTISITNSIAFANLRDPARQFGPVRLWGTIGWIVASWPFIFILVDWAKVPAMGDVGFTDWIGKALGTSLAGSQAMELKNYIFLIAGFGSLALAGFSLLLPHTPPKPATGEDSLAWVKAMKLLKQPFVLVLFLVTFIDAAVHQSFFYWTATFLGPVKEGGVVDIPGNWVVPVMKIGQIAEIVTMLFLGYVLKTFGWRTTMIVGVLGHAARFAVFAFYPEKEAAIAINALHGICYAFFFATVYIFVDEYFPKDVRSSAQGLFNVLILGVGPFFANFACGKLNAVYTQGGTLNYSAVYQYSMFAGIIGALSLALFFHPPKSPAGNDLEATPAP